MSESNVISELLQRAEASVLDGMHSQLDQARIAGAKPIKWLVRLEETHAVMNEARAAGGSDLGPDHDPRIPMHGSWKLLDKGEGPLLMCEGDEMHRALLASYEAR